MKLNLYLPEIANFISEDITSGIVGTGTTQPTSDDTNLESSDNSTIKPVESITSDNSVKFTYLLRSTDTNLLVSEFGLFNSSGKYINRDVFPEVSKDDTVDLTIIKEFIII